MEQTGYVATIGMFDGVHRGHQYVLGQLTACARQRGLKSLVVTFDRPFKQEHVLTPLDEKLALLKAAGVDRCEVLSFTPALKSLSAQQFMARLKEQWNVCVLLTGYDNRFGHNRAEGFDDYVRYGQDLGIDVLGLRAEGTVSSSVIRQQLAAGDVRGASAALGRYYAVKGRVVAGEHVGTGLGYPTANLRPEDALQLLPDAGVYAVQVACDGWKAGMMNIGTRPTFGTHPQTLEVHVLDYAGNLYGQLLEVRFLAKIRDEHRFSSAEGLKAQLKADEAEIRKIMSAL